MGRPVCSLLIFRCFFMIKKMLNPSLRTIWLLCGIVLMVGGCASMKSDTPPPEWVLNPPKDTAESYWGVGEGYDLEAAKRTALKDVAARLRVSISGNMESQVAVRNDAVDRSARSKISEVVQKTEFTNFSVEKTAKSNDGLYTLVKVDRRAFIKETRVKFENLNKLIQESTRDLSRKTPLEQFQTFRGTLPNIENAIAVGQLLRVADTAFSGGGEISRLESLQQKALAAAGNLVFALQFKPGDADIAQVVTGFINANGMRIAGSGESGLLIAISSSVRQEVLFGNRNVRLQLTLNLRDEKKQNVAAKEYLINGNSLDTFEAARQDAMRVLANAMKSAGAAGGLGLKE